MTSGYRSPNYANGTVWNLTPTSSLRRKGQPETAFLVFAPLLVGEGQQATRAGWGCSRDWSTFMTDLATPAESAAPLVEKAVDSRPAPSPDPESIATPAELVP